MPAPRISRQPLGVSGRRVTPLVSRSQAPAAARAVGKASAAYTYTEAYGGTKAFVLNFTRSLQQELAEARSAVRVQLVTPAATVFEIWEVSGFDLKQLDPAIVMTTEALVDAALKGLDMGEPITAPPVQNPKILADYLAAADALLLEATSHGQPAPRYTA